MVARILQQKAIQHCEGTADILGVGTGTSLFFLIFSVAPVLVESFARGQTRDGIELGNQFDLMKRMLIMHFFSCLFNRFSNVFSFDPHIHFES